MDIPSLLFALLELRDKTRTYATEPGVRREIGPRFDADKFSDDYCQGLSFTGTLIGLCVQELSGRRKHTDFDHFTYRE